MNRKKNKEEQTMNKTQLYLSTTAGDAEACAGAYGVGIEIAEFCTAWNMDDEYAATDAALRKKLEGVERRLLHGPFNELFPCAIDPQARALAAKRYRQAIRLARHYGASKVIIHGGYHPWIYYPQWYTEQSVVFWKEFLKEDPGVELVLENVFETDPAWLAGIVQAVDDERLRLCLDVGHAHAYSKAPVMDWLEVCAPWISHFHIHNNDTTWDLHNPLDQGTIPMTAFLEKAARLCPDATYTLELTEAESSLGWLVEQGLL